MARNRNKKNKGKKPKVEAPVNVEPSVSEENGAPNVADAPQQGGSAAAQPTDIEEFLEPATFESVSTVPKPVELNLGFSILPSQSFPINQEFDDNVRSTCQVLARAEYGSISYPVGGIDRSKYNFPINLAHPEHIVIPPIALPGSQLDRFLWRNYVAGMISPWIDTDHPNSLIAKASVKGLEEEIRHAAFIGMKVIMVPVSRIATDNLFKLIQHLVTVESLDVTICLLFPTNIDNFIDEPPEEFQDVYNHWVVFRRSLPFYLASRLSVGLYVMENQLSPEFLDSLQFNRWAGETVDVVIFGAESFVFQAMPLQENTELMYLERNHRMLFADLAVVPEQQLFLFAPDCRTWPKQRLSVNHRFMSDVQRQMQINRVNKDDHSGRKDTIHLPMETIWKDLTGESYDSMEEDVLKYNIYGESLVNFWDEFPSDYSEKIYIYVLGAGRGGLIKAIYNATERNGYLSKFKVEIIAIEKNPGAIMSLTYMIHRYNRKYHHVRIIPGDFRIVLKDQSLPKADFILSDFIGSFGDNELCPELWEYVYPILKATTVSIPQQIQTYICPVAAPRVNEQIIEAYDPKRATSCRIDPISGKPLFISPENWSDQVFVAPLRRCHDIGEPHPLFKYMFPTVSGEPKTFAFDYETDFQIPFSVEVTGFVGYFVLVMSELYTVSNTKRFREEDNVAVQSWYPAYIPLRDRGIHVQGNTFLHLWFKRCVAPDGVWYEWQCEYTPYGTTHRVKTELQNSNGKTCFMPFVPPRNAGVFNEV